MLERIDSVVRGLQARFGGPPEVGVVLGSGLGAFSAALDDPQRAAYPELGLPGSNVPGHAGELVVGTISGRRVACFSGRLHLYEGHDAATAALGIRALARWGARGVVLSSAVGGVDPTLGTGELLLVSDHINLLGANPLRGPNLDAVGVRFPDLSNIYTPRLRALAQRIALTVGPGRPLREGVYAGMPGPSYETPAEVRMLRLLGADVVGMSLIPESIAAAHAGLEVLAVSVVANPAAGLTDEKLAHADVTAAVNKAAEAFTALVRGVVAAW